MGKKYAPSGYQIISLENITNDILSGENVSVTLPQETEDEKKLFTLIKNAYLTRKEIKPFLLTIHTSNGNYISGFITMTNCKDVEMDLSFVYSVVTDGVYRLLSIIFEDGATSLRLLTSSLI